jgi:hypothetical protein
MPLHQLTPPPCWTGCSLGEPLLVAALHTIQCHQLQRPPHHSVPHVCRDPDAAHVPTRRLLGYWVIRVLSYSAGVDPFSGPVGRDRREGKHSGSGAAGSGKKQEQPKEGEEEGLTGLTHAHVRSYVDMTKETRDPVSGVNPV